MKIVIARAIASLTISGCAVSEDECKHALCSQGFTSIYCHEDYDMLSCGEGDKKLGKKFSANNSNGARVTGTVCCGMFFKGCTVRW